MQDAKSDVLPVATPSKEQHQHNIDLANFNFGAFQLSTNTNVAGAHNMAPMAQRNIFYDQNTTLQMPKQQLGHQSDKAVNEGF
ncbi:unnamed protein product [Toxocara canis]|uniref:Uncharacterized protein n=1 Tax=Toxocara canis TaxID=6265 RepID=A0A183V8K3_TOXCA|nr:unnamed protein product [Toxocara canis]